MKLFLLLVSSAFILFLIWHYYWGYLILNDITTTPEKPPQFHKLEEYHKKKTDFSQQKDFYPHLSPTVKSETPEEVFSKILAFLAKHPRYHLIHQDPSHLRIEFTDTTDLLKFTDDLVIEVRPESKGSSVHLRSASRIGKGDLGANATRIQLLQSLLSSPEEQ